MNVYKVKRTDGLEPNEYDEAIICAESPERALEIAAEKLEMDEYISAKLIDTTQEGVILASFESE